MAHTGRFTMGQRTLTVSVLAMAALLLAACSSLPSLPPEPPELNADNQARMDWSKRFLDGWQPGQGAIRLRPAVGEQYIYAAHSDGQVMALHKETGRIAWRKTFTPWQAGVTLADDRLYLLNQEGVLKVLDAVDGSELDSAELAVTTLAPPAVAGGRVAILAQDGSLRLWDISDRSWVWIHESEQPSLTLHGQARPMIVGDQVIAGFANGRLAAFAMQDGELRWAHRLSDPRGSSDLQRIVDVDAQPILIDGRLYAAAYEGRIVEINPDTGEIAWQQEKSVTANLATDGRSLFVATRSGEVFAYDLGNKGERWHQQGYAGRPITGLSVSGNSLIMTDRRGYAHVLSTQSGETRGRINFRGTQNFTVSAGADSDRFYLQSMQGLVSGNSIRTPQE